MIFLIGGTGLVGSAFARLLKKKKIKHKIITSKNRHIYMNKSCDLVIDCNGNGSKRVGTLYPFFDFNASVGSVVENLIKIKYKKYVYISTISTYSDLSEKKYTKEDVKVNYKNLGNYGFNKLIAENYVKKYSKKYLIIRLPYLVGPGLKRNPIYDLSHNKQTFVSLNSEINCIHTDTIAEITMKLINNKRINNQIYNLGSKNTIRVNQILDLCDLKKSQLKKTIKTKDKTIFNCDKIKKIVSLPSSYSQIKKYLDNIK